MTERFHWSISPKTLDAEVAEGKEFFQWIDVIMDMRRHGIPVRFSPQGDQLDHAQAHLHETYGTRT